MNSGQPQRGWRGPRSWMTGTRARQSSSRPVSSACTSSAAGGAGRSARAVAQGKARATGVAYSGPERFPAYCRDDMRLTLAEAAASPRQLAPTASCARSKRRAPGYLSPL